MVALTERAVSKVKEIIEAQAPRPAGLRIAVVGGGCSGFSYKLSFEDGAQGDDHVVEAFGLRVLVDPKSAPIVAGSTLEFKDAMLGGGFKVNNPQAVHECACGESFSI